MPTKKTAAAKPAAPKKTIYEIEKKDIVLSLEQCESPEELAAYVSTNFGEISMEAAELFFHFINK